MESDYPVENFSEHGSECKRCTSYRNCLFYSQKAEEEKIVDSEKRIPIYKTAEYQERQTTFFRSPKLTADDVADFKIDLNTKNIIKELENENSHRNKNRRSS